MPNELQLGGDDDIVRLRVDGKDVHIAKSYDVHVSVLQQPAAFTLRLGWGKTAAELFDVIQKGMKFELLIAGSVIQSGQIDAVGAPSSNVTEVEVRGRDSLAPLFDSYIEEEQSFTENNYYDLTRRVLDIVGLTEASGHVLEKTNDANRELVGRVKVPVDDSTTEDVRQIDTGASSGGSRIVYQSLKAKLGTTWFDFLERHYKLAGLFIWAGADGRIILARPRANVPAAYRLIRRRPTLKTPVYDGLGTVIDAHYDDNSTNRHASYTVHGRVGSAGAGRERVKGTIIDIEMVNAGFTKARTEFDEDVTTQDEAEFVARRQMAEEHRAGWVLEYTLSGHTTLSSYAVGKTATWANDHVVDVRDYELGIAGDYYIESINYRRGPQTTTTIALMRPEDLVFSKEEESNRRVKEKKHRRKTREL